MYEGAIGAENILACLNHQHNNSWNIYAQFEIGAAIKSNYFFLLVDIAA